MKYKKFLIIPILIFFYLFFVVDFLVNYNLVVFPKMITESFGPTEVIGIGETVSVVVTRPYLLGLVRLPVYTNAMGDIGIIHDAFFYFVGILIVVFVVIEWRKRK